MARAARHIIQQKVGTNSGVSLVRRLEKQILRGLERVASAQRLEDRAQREIRSLFNLEGTRPGVLYGPVAQLARAYD